MSKKISRLVTTNNGKLLPELFVKDMLHINSDGYKLWQKALEPYL